MRYSDRHEAGQELAKHLAFYCGKDNTIILALPRGGVPVAYEIAKILELPLDLMLVRKLGVPGHNELAMGAIASGGVRVLNEDVVRHLRLSPTAIERVAEIEEAELLRRSQVYRGTHPLPVLKDKTVILVDDGMATGANMRAAVEAVRRQGASHVIVVAPVASDSAVESLKALADEIVCPYVPDVFYGVGGFYDDFGQTDDQEVIALLSAHKLEEANHGRIRA